MNETPYLGLGTLLELKFNSPARVHGALGDSGLRPRQQYRDTSCDKRMLVKATLPTSAMLDLSYISSMINGKP